MPVAGRRGHMNGLVITRLARRRGAFGSHLTHRTRMNTVSKGLLISALLMVACAPQKPGTPSPRLATPPEVRALWVVRNTLDHPDSIRAMVARAHENGFNTLIVQVRGRGDAFYNARWEPRAASIVKDAAFDPLALTIEEAHRHGIAVHAWLNTTFLANMDTPPTDPTHIYMDGRARTL
jgi:uncharacterized lipoprotein YddW (UPF0748 family)